MQNLAPRLAAILAKYMRDPAAHVSGATKLADIGIDELDMLLIAIDIEDTFDIELSSDDREAFSTVGSLAARTAAAIEEQARRPLRRTTVPRSRGSWMSTGA